MAQQPLDGTQHKRLQDSLIDKFEMEQTTPERRRREWSTTVVLD